MKFQSPEHARSYRRACKALASARREAFRAASGMSTAELRMCEPDYRRATGAGFDLGGEALTQLRMIRTILRHRTRSTRSRSRAAQQYRAARS
jgi:hypothetical protein